MLANLSRACLGARFYTFNLLVLLLYFCRIRSALCERNLRGQGTTNSGCGYDKFRVGYDKFRVWLRQNQGLATTKSGSGYDRFRVGTTKSGSGHFEPRNVSAGRGVGGLPTGDWPAELRLGRPLRADKDSTSGIMTHLFLRVSLFSTDQLRCAYVSTQSDAGR